MVFVKDWSHRYGRKVLLTRSGSSPEITLGATENTLSVSVACYERTGRYDPKYGPAAKTSTTHPPTAAPPNTKAAHHTTTTVTSKTKLHLIHAATKDFWLTPSAATTTHPVQPHAGLGFWFNKAPYRILALVLESSSSPTLTRQAATPQPGALESERTSANYVRR